MLLFTVAAARGAKTDGALRVELITAYNLVVDSNAGTPSSYAPRSAYVGVRFFNDGSGTLSDVIACIGDFKGGVGSTPGLYPLCTKAGLTGPLSGGAFAFTHEGGSSGLADATRYILSIPSGGYVTVYWLVSYPQLDTLKVPTWGKSVGPEDDLALRYDVWATAKEGAATRSVSSSRTMTCRNEISASANKIYPNTANKVPDYYKALMNQYIPSWTNANLAAIGTRIITEGFWYDLGSVGAGFDNDGDLTPDRNAWLQPVGDPGLFDPGAFRLMHAYAFLILKLRDGTDQVLVGDDQLYFTNIPECNSAVGFVRYEFMPLVAGASSRTTPYQEVASGNDNEKFNSDYGVALGELLIGTNATVSLSKTASAATILPGATNLYAIAFTNSGSSAAGDAMIGLPLVIQDKIPTGTLYVAGSAAASNTAPAGVPGYRVLFSTDGGLTWSATEPSPASVVTHLQWWLNGALPAGAAGTVRFSVQVSGTYALPNPIINNVAGLSFGSGVPFAYASAVTRVLGNNALGDKVFADIGTGEGAYYANGLQDGSEGGLNGILVLLYSDVNGNGAIGGDEPLVAMTSTDSFGNYLFTGLFDGNYVAAVDTLDADVPSGYTATTARSFAVALDPTGQTGVGVTNLLSDYGFAPALMLDKYRAITNDLRKGTLVTYSLFMTNRLAGTGSSVPVSAQYLIWPTNGTAGAAGAGFTSATNAWQANEPDGQYANAPYSGQLETMTTMGYYRGPQPGNITNVNLVIPLVINGSYANNGATLEISVTKNGAQIGTNVVLLCSSLTSGTLFFNVKTFQTNWPWADFRGTNLSVTLLSRKDANTKATINVDSVGFQLITDQMIGGKADSTLDPVPLTDTYDTARLRYVSASVPPDSVTTNSGAGSIYWSSLGPIYSGGARSITVTFEALQPPGNRAAPTTNTASVTAATFMSGRAANAAQDLDGANVLPSGTIGDFVWRDLNGNGLIETNEPGVFNVAVTLTPPAGVDLGSGAGLPVTNFTDAGGAYLFKGLPASGTYTVAVVSSTLPGGAGTPTFDLDGTASANSAKVPLVYDATNGADTVVSADFGYSLQTAIRGTVWHDLDRNGAALPDSGEDLLTNVTVKLLDATGTLVLATTNTSASGTFQFVGPYSGSYVVQAFTNTGSLGIGTWTRSYDTNGTNTPDVVSLTVATNSVAVANYSYYQTGAYTIGDTLFYDWNTNGVQDAGVDTGIAAVTVRLYQDENTNGVVDAGVDALVGTAETAASGLYSFSGLPSGKYLVLVDEADTNFPSLYLRTADPQGALDSRSVVVINSSSNLVQDFGYQPYGFNTLGDTVWRDINADGRQSGAFETGISNVVVRLYQDLDNDGTYTLARTNLTDAAGHYLFSALPDGAYRVSVSTNDPALPKDAFNYLYPPTTPVDYSVTLAGGVSILTDDFGFSPLGAIGNQIFWDNNASGGQDWNESGISNVTVRLYLDKDTNGVYSAGDTLLRTNVTDGAGAYLFTGLARGNYVVFVDTNSPALAGAVLRADPQMDGAPCPVPPAQDTTCDSQSGVTILPGVSFMGADFGYQPAGGVIGDLLWLDLNTNGVFDAGERGIPYISVVLYGGSVPVATNATDADGFYTFGNLTNGTYQVGVLTNDVEFPAGLAPSSCPDGTLDNLAANIVVSGGHIVNIGVQAVSNADLTVDFGYRYAGGNSLSGTVGLDASPSDGLLNGSAPSGVAADESPFADTLVYVYLWKDANGDAVVDSGERALLASTLTAANGDYSFTGLPGGSGTGTNRFIVSLQAPAADLKLTTVTGNTPALLVVVSTNSAGSALSAYQVVAIAAQQQNIDFAFATADVRDYGDLPDSYGTTISDRPNGASHKIIPGQDLWLGGGVSSESNGRPNTHALADDKDDGVAVRGRWREGLTNGVVDVKIGAGNGWLAAWVDFNQDGNFTNANERVVSCAVSNAVNGGSYTLPFDIPAGAFKTNGPTVLNARFRLFPSKPLIESFAGPVSGGEVEDYQFVFGLLGNRVWEDMNGNGVQDSGEPGIAGVTVQLKSVTNTLLEAATTTADGVYLFNGLPTNDYALAVVAPEGMRFSPKGAGSDRSVDSDADATGSVGRVSLTVNPDGRFRDAGLYIPAALFGYLFVDNNANLVRDSGDVPVTNRNVYLSVYGVNVAVTNTDEIGYYCFGDVVPGAATVAVANVAGDLINVPTGGSEAGNEHRNRAVMNAANAAFISHPVVSGYGAIPRPRQPLGVLGMDLLSLSSVMMDEPEVSLMGTTQ